MSRPGIAIVGHTAIPHDPRIAKQTRALVDAGFEVDVFGLREPGEPPEERHDGVRLVRLPMNRRWRGVAGHMAEYAAFTAMAAVALARAHRERRYRLVQVATPPDFLVAAALPARALRTPLLLDLHEDMPAMFFDRFDRPLLRHVMPLVRGVSIASAALADELVTVHEPLREILIERGAPPERVSVVMNGADSTVFDRGRFPRRPFMADGVLRLVHHSSLHRLYGADIAVDAVGLLAPDVPVVLDIYGDGPFAPDLRRIVETRGLGSRVRLHGRVPLDSLPARIADADIGLVPTRPDPYARLLLSTKLLEYAAMGQRIVASDLATYRAHFTPDAVGYVAAGEAEALADAVREIARDPSAADGRAEEAVRQAAAYSWQSQAARYVDLVRRMSRA